MTFPALKLAGTDAGQNPVYRSMITPVPIMTPELQWLHHTSNIELQTSNIKHQTLYPLPLTSYPLHLTPYTLSLIPYPLFPGRNLHLRNLNIAGFNKKADPVIVLAVPFILYADPDNIIGNCRFVEAA